MAPSGHTFFGINSLCILQGLYRVGTIRGIDRQLGVEWQDRDDLPDLASLATCITIDVVAIATY